MPIANPHHPPVDQWMEPHCNSIVDEALWRWKLISTWLWMNGASLCHFLYFHNFLVWMIFLMWDGYRTTSEWWFPLPYSQYLAFLEEHYNVPNVEPTISSIVKRAGFAIFACEGHSLHLCCLVGFDGSLSPLCVAYNAHSLGDKWD
jgi:hypothetical protein